MTTPKNMKRVSVINREGLIDELYPIVAKCMNDNESIIQTGHYQEMGVRIAGRIIRYLKELEVNNK